MPRQEHWIYLVGQEASPEMRRNWGESIRILELLGISTEVWGLRFVVLREDYGGVWSGRDVSDERREGRRGRA